MKERVQRPVKTPKRVACRSSQAGSWVAGSSGEEDEDDVEVVVYVWEETWARGTKSVRRPSVVGM
jgi:hypothetical protein